MGLTDLANRLRAQNLPKGSRRYAFGLAEVPIGTRLNLPKGSRRCDVDPCRWGDAIVYNHVTNLPKGSRRYAAATIPFGSMQSTSESP